MKKNKYKISEIKNVIANTKISPDDNFMQLLKKDLRDLFFEYFNFESDMLLNIEKRGGEYFVMTELKIQNIKSMKKLNY